MKKLSEIKINKLTYAFNVRQGNYVECVISFPAQDKVRWPESWEKLQRTRWCDGGDLKRKLGDKVINTCPTCDLYYVADGSHRKKLRSSVTFQFDSNNESYGVISTVSGKFKVEEPFKTLELVAAPNNCSHDEFVIGVCVPKYPVECTYDLKKTMYTSRNKKGGRFVVITDESWNVESGEGRKTGVANDVTVMFGKFYGYKISEVCSKAPEYAAFLMTTSSVGADTANSNLQSCQSYIDAHLDWKTVLQKQAEESEKRRAAALLKGTVIEFEGECFYKEKKYNRAALWLPQNERDRLNFDCIMIYCDDGMTLKVEKRMKSLTGRVKGTAVIDWYGPKSGIYGVTDVKIHK